MKFFSDVCPTFWGGATQDDVAISIHMGPRHPERVFLREGSPECGTTIRIAYRLTEKPNNTACKVGILEIWPVLVKKLIFIWGSFPNTP